MQVRDSEVSVSFLACSSQRLPAVTSEKPAPIGVVGRRAHRLIPDMPTVTSPFVPAAEYELMASFLVRACGGSWNPVN